MLSKPKHFWTNDYNDPTSACAEPGILSKRPKTTCHLATASVLRDHRRDKCYDTRGNSSPPSRVYFCLPACSQE